LCRARRIRSLDSDLRTAGTLGAARRAPSISPSSHPREQQKRQKPDVQLREHQLAWQAAGEPRGHHQPDRRDHNQHRAQGLRALDDRTYDKGIEVSDEQLAAVCITRDPFHGEWNYAVSPSLTAS
jgi:hypothetical protein